MDSSKLTQYTGHEYDIYMSDSGSGLLYDISGRWAYCGSVADYSSLPSNAQNGDVYYVTALGIKYFWNGSAWEAVGDATVQVPVDNVLSTTSTNPVQNKVITSAINSMDTAYKAADDALDARLDTIEANPSYKDSTWSDSTRTIEFTKTDGTTKSHIIPTGDSNCYTSSTWDETNRNLTLTKGDGTSATHNIKISEGSNGILTFVTTDGTTVTKAVISNDDTPYTLYFELSDGTVVAKTIVEESTE